MAVTQRLEASVVHSITTQLSNLGWVVDERDPRCNVTQQRVKTQNLADRLQGNRPDFVLYQNGTSRPIAIIEAKRPGMSLDRALDQAEEQYGRPLDVPLLFAYNDTFVLTRYLHNGRPLRIDGEEVRDFVDHYTALQFVEQGPEILSVPEHIKVSREQLIAIFKRASNLLREAGLQAGLERFGAFSDILFLKIMDEMCELRQHAGEEPPIPEYLRWSKFAGKSPEDLHGYLTEVVWPEMNRRYGAVFGDSLQISSPAILGEIVTELSEPGLNLTASDTDVKGDAFEYFLENAYQGVRQKDLGEYFTPRNVVKMMISMVDPQIGENIYDPFCGTGGFLIEAFRYLRLRVRDRAKWDRVLREETIYGSEITVGARIAKMNMILFGDGSSNVVREDSLGNPKRGAFDIVVTNPPYSTTTRHGNLYGVTGQGADPICIAHCLDALNENGRAALLVKEDFLTGEGQSRLVRERLMREAKDFTVVSLPRRLFEPYTPTKTSIIYFEKGGHRDNTYFFVVNNVGHSLGPRKRLIDENDLPRVLEGFNEGQEMDQIDSAIIDNELIRDSDHSLWIYDYLEKLPDFPVELSPLGDFIERSGERVKPQEYPDEEFSILGVNKLQGIFENEVKLGSEINQNYIRVRTGDLVYNPHRVNVGSIGIVTDTYDGGYVSPIYVVFRSTDEQMPATLIWSLLKSRMYRDIVRAYDTRQGAVRANLTFEQLCRIQVPILSDVEMEQFLTRQENWERLSVALQQTEQDMFDFVGSLSEREDT